MLSKKLMVTFSRRVQQRKECRNSLGGTTKPRSTYDSSKLQTGAAAWSQGIAKYLRSSSCVVTVMKLGVVLVVVVDDEEIRRDCQ